MKKTLFYGLLLLFTSMQLFSNSIVQYEYWFDDSFDYRTTQQVANQQEIILLENIDLSSLSVGLHRFNIRFQDSLGLWSAVKSSFFIYKGNFSGDNNIIGYEYWLDDNFAERTFTEIESTQDFILIENLDLSAQTVGLHRFNIRFQDSYGFWSALKSSFFIYKGTYFGENNLIGYEYWLDDDFAERTFTEIESTQDFILIENIDLSAQTVGLHRFNIRFQDSNGFWSALKSSFFIYKGAYSGENNVIAYQYWFDDDFTNNIYTEISPEQEYVYIDNLEAENFSFGLHKFNIRFQDSYGFWSGVKSSFFFKRNYFADENLITEFRYWFDDNFEELQTEEFETPVQLAEIIDNIQLPEFADTTYHLIHFQFKDISGLWSASYSSQFAFGNYDLVTTTLLLPLNEAIDVELSPTLSWLESESATNYRLQVALNEDFTNLFIDSSDIEETDFTLNGLNLGTQYFWRVLLTDGFKFSPWSEVWSFTTTTVAPNIEIELSSGWNTISSNILSNAPNMEDMFAEMEELVIVKNADGQIYNPSQNINQIGDWNIAHGYMVYVTAPATLQITGTAVDPTETEINLVSGWNLVSYLRNSQMPVETALAGISSSIILVKNNLGQLYYPVYGLNTIGNMIPGQGYWIYMNSNAVLVYPGN